MYNLTLATESGTLLDFVVFLNDSTYQVLFSLFMIGIFFIMVLSLKRYPLEKGLLSASWVCLLLSSFLYYAGLLNLLFPLGFLLIAAFSGLYIFQNR